MRADYHFPRMLGSKPVGSDFGSFVSRAIGVTGSDFLGRLEVLDLESSEPCWYIAPPTPGLVDFACLCTLLPFSRSLRSLWVTAHSRQDLVWLAYAILHPATAATRWRTLYFDDEVDLASDYAIVTPWPDFDRVVRSRSPLAAIWSELQWPTVTSEPLAEPNAPSTGFGWRTATVDRATDFLSLDKEHAVARLHGGERVELCDIDIPIEAFGERQYHQSGENNYVAAILRGVGAGWVRMRDIAAVEDTHFDSPPRSPLKTLTLFPELQRVPETGAFLSFCGASLLHLRVTHFALYGCGDLTRYCPRLVSLEMPMVEINFKPYTLPPLPHLLYLGVIGYHECIDDCFRLMHGHPRLQTIRLRVDATYSGPNERAIIRHANALIASTPSLRSLTVMISQRRRPDDEDRFAIDAPSARELSRKLAFLSAVRSSALLGRLDSDVLHYILALAGPSLRCVVAFVKDVLRRASPMVWPDDWYDTNREGLL